MKPALGLFSLAALLSLIGVSAWATSHVSIVPAIQDMFANPGQGFTPWLVATLVDAYYGFLWFWLWVAYKETRWLSRSAWLLAILLTGNMAMAVYMLIQLLKLPPNPSAKDLLLRRA